MMSKISREPLGSSWEVGSSITSTRGAITIIEAIATSCC